VVYIPVPDNGHYSACSKLEKFTSEIWRLSSVARVEKEVNYGKDDIKGY
jgi:hypothetical protein